MTPGKLLPITVALLASSCVNSGDNATPRPEGFARIEAYPASYTALPHTGTVTFEANDSAVAIPAREHPAGDGGRWVTLSYPRYGALLYLTFTPVTEASVEEVIANRLERMALNSGETASMLTELESPGGYSSRIITTHAGTVTPVQFLSVRNDSGMVVSGAVFIDGADMASSPDSLAPVIDYLERDIVHALKHLK